MTSWLDLITTLFLAYCCLNRNSTETINTIFIDEYRDLTVDCDGTENCTIICDTNSGCRDAQINCPIDYPCDMTCSAPYSCEGATFNCPHNNSCNILCNADYACQYSVINATYSSSLYLNDCANGFFTCTDTTIYFPPNDHGKPRAICNAGDDGFSGYNQPMQFYAIFGWNDVNITNYQGQFDYHSGVMHCGIRYNYSCDFDANAWKCANDSHICMVTAKPTTQPTIQPTEPSIQPTHDPTHTPSYNPTLIPTYTIPPSLHPSLQPSLQPSTITPTKDLTVNPTVQSTLSDTTLTFILSTTVFESSKDQESSEIKDAHAVISSENDILIIIATIMGVCIVLALFDIYHSKSEKGLCNICGIHPSDQFNYSIIIIFGLKICDMITDISISYYICLYYFNGNSDNDKDILILLISILSIICIVIPYVFTILAMKRLINLPSKTEGPALWFERYTLFYVILLIVTCDSYLSLKLISSHIFGIKLFNSGHSSLDLKRIRSIKIVTILTQNVPAIVVQLSFSVAILNNISSLFIISMIISFILSIPLLISWYLTKNNLFKTLVYNIEITLIPPLDNDGKRTSHVHVSPDKTFELSQILRYSGYKRILRKKLALILGIHPSKLEIGYIDMTQNGNGCKISIIHSIPRSTSADVQELYRDKYLEIAAIIKEIYNISIDWTVVCILDLSTNTTNNSIASSSVLISKDDVVDDDDLVFPDTTMQMVQVNDKDNDKDKDKDTPYGPVTAGGGMDIDYATDMINKQVDQKKKKLKQKLNNNINKSNVALIALNDDDDDNENINNLIQENVQKKNIDADLDRYLPDVPDAAFSVDSSKRSSNAFGGANDNPFSMLVNIKVIPQPQIKVTADGGADDEESEDSEDSDNYKQ